MCYSSVDKVRYFKANNEYLPNYDPKHPSSYIMYMYLNANNLYGWAMSQSLLFAEFKWLTIYSQMHFKIRSAFRDWLHVGSRSRVSPRAP